LLMVEELAEEYDPIDLAAAAFSLLLKEVEQEDTITTVAGDAVGVEPGMARLFIDVGRSEKVRPADLVGAIANESGVPGKRIGSIEIYDRFSFVEVPADAAQRVLRALSETTIRGKRVKVSIAKPKR
jgi:ATP-dependent RNA helicase DeaD